MRADRSRLSTLIQELVSQPDQEPLKHWAKPPTPIEPIRGRLLICCIADVPSDFPIQIPNVTGRVSYVVIWERARSLPSARDNVIAFELPPGKKGQILFLQHVLPKAMPFIQRALEEDAHICVCCESGRDASVGIVVAALQKFFDEAGHYLGPHCEPGTLYSSISSRRTNADHRCLAIYSRPRE